MLLRHYLTCTGFTVDGNKVNLEEYQEIMEKCFQDLFKGKYDLERNIVWNKGNMYEYHWFKEKENVRSDN